MATVTKGLTFSSTETITNTKLHNLVDLATVTAIVNNDIDASASIADTKLAGITTAGVVNGSSLTGLGNVPSGAGTIPVANIDTGTTANKIVKLDNSGRIPAVDASLLTNLNAATLDTYDTSTTAVASRIPVTNSSGLLTSFVTKAALGIDTGTIELANNVENTITFNFTFSSAPKVFTTMIKGSDYPNQPAAIGTITTTTAKIKQTSGATYTAQWLAIGTPA